MGWVFRNFNLHEGCDLGPADGALVVLHSDDSAAGLTQAKVATRQDYSVFIRAVANYAFFLSFI